MNNEAAVNRKISTQNRSKLRTTVQIGMLGAIALVLMFLNFRFLLLHRLLSKWISLRFRCWWELLQWDL